MFILLILASLFCLKWLLKLSKKRKAKLKEDESRAFGDDFKERVYQDKRDAHSTDTDFQHAIVTLFACIMKADGVYLKSELYVIKSNLLQNFGEQRTIELLQILKQLLHSNYNAVVVAQQAALLIRKYADIDTLAGIYQTCFEIAFADHDYNTNEQQLLYAIGVGFGMSKIQILGFEQHMMYEYQNIFRHQQQQHYQQQQQYQRQTQQRTTTLSRAYSLLGITQTATNEEVKKAYRTMAAQNHPDRYANESAEVQQQATKRFQEINEAYDYIKASRGIN